MRVLSEGRERSPLAAWHWELVLMLAGVCWLAVIGAVVVVAWIVAQL